jgi:hypothetical protein
MVLVVKISPSPLSAFPETVPHLSELSKIGFDRLLPVVGSPIRNEITITNNQRVLVATAAGIRLKSA